MHELSITQAILDIALRHATASKAARVTHLNITIGELSSFVDDSIQFYWDLISQGTPCAGATLNFTRVPAKLTCLECGDSYSISGGLIPCPTCSSRRVKIAEGDDFRVDSMDVEVEENPLSEGLSRENDPLLQGIQIENCSPAWSRDIP
jgi:hydrogenase nickel incorporation protein HypA/HybF